MKTPDTYNDDDEGPSTSVDCYVNSCQTEYWVEWCELGEDGYWYPLPDQVLSEPIQSTN